MKMFDHQSTARRNWLRDEQAARIAPSESARQSNIEKSKVFRWTVVACLIFVVVNVFQDDPVVVTTTAYQVTV
jgi:ribosomal silencing factor RsfS